jgi:thymidylate synthase
VFGAQLRFDLRAGFPLVTTKKLHLRSIIHELLWFLRGDTHLRYLHEHGVTIWDEWATNTAIWGRFTASSGPTGKQRMAGASTSSPTPSTCCGATRIRGGSWCRRGTWAIWSECVCLPCHLLFQFYVANGELSCQLYQRSADLFLGVPFNIASYALLTHLVAQQTDLRVGEFIWTGGDCHLYLNHLEQARLQLSREPLLAAAASDDSRRFRDFGLSGAPESKRWPTYR